MDDELLSHLLAAVGQQLGSPQTRYVAQTYQRLRELGIDEVEAKTQIALCLAQEMDQILRSKRPFDEAAYRELLAGLPFPEEEPDESGIAIDLDPDGISS
jgi:hypothetical protein